MSPPAPIRQHHCAQARSFRVLWLLEEIGADYALVRHSIFDKALRAPGFRALSPAGRVPALEIDGTVLAESGAIIEYLCETRAPELGRAPGSAERAAWLQWLHYAETLGQHLANLTQQHGVLREDWMRSPVLMRLEARRLALALDAVSAAVSGRDWLLASGFSAVDVAVGYSVATARRFVPLDPALAAYHARLAARPAFARAQAKDGPAEVYLRDFYEAPDG